MRTKGRDEGRVRGDKSADTSADRQTAVWQATGTARDDVRERDDREFDDRWSGEMRDVVDAWKLLSHKRSQGTRDA